MIGKSRTEVQDIQHQLKCHFLSLLGFTNLFKHAACLLSLTCSVTALQKWIVTVVGYVSYWFAVFALIVLSDFVFLFVRRRNAFASHFPRTDWKQKEVHQNEVMSPTPKLTDVYTKEPNQKHQT